MCPIDFMLSRFQTGFGGFSSLSEEHKEQSMVWLNNMKRPTLGLLKQSKYSFDGF